MTTYNVHIYREMRLVYSGIEATTHEAAASIARDKPTDEADSIDDCEGETFAALVDVAGDEQYEQTRLIDFEEERLRKAAPSCKLALKAFLEADELAEECGEWKWENLDHAFRAARSAIAEAEAAAIPSDPAETDTPIVTVEVRGGLIEDMEATRPVHVVVEDWDITDDDTGEKPFRNVWSLDARLTGPKAEKLRRLIAND